jgi:hypothetical protein
MMTSRSQEATLGNGSCRLRRTSTLYSPISEDLSYSCNCIAALRVACIALASQSLSKMCSGPDWRVARSAQDLGSDLKQVTFATQLEDDVGSAGITEHSKLPTWRLRPKIDSSARHGFDRVEHELRLSKRRQRTQRLF